MKLVVIGNSKKVLTHNVVKSLLDNGNELKLVVLKAKQQSKTNILKKGLNYFKKFGFTKLLKSGIQKAKQSTISTIQLCKNNDIGCITTPNLNDRTVEDAIRKISPDVIILAGSSLIKENVFTLAKLYTINIHRSLLPKYAGLSAIFWALYHNEDKIGATVHVVEKKIDTGEIIVQREKVVEPTDNLDSLTEWYYANAGGLIIEALEKISDPNHVFQKQDPNFRSYFRRPTPQQLLELENRLREKSLKKYQYDKKNY